MRCVLIILPPQSYVRKNHTSYVFSWSLVALSDPNVSSTLITSSEYGVKGPSVVLTNCHTRVLFARKVIQPRCLISQLNEISPECFVRATYGDMKYCDSKYTGEWGELEYRFPSAYVPARVKIILVIRVADNCQKRFLLIAS